MSPTETFTETQVAQVLADTAQFNPVPVRQTKVSNILQTKTTKRFFWSGRLPPIAPTLASMPKMHTCEFSVEFLRSAKNNASLGAELKTGAGKLHQVGNPRPQHTLRALPTRFLQRLEEAIAVSQKHRIYASCLSDTARGVPPSVHAKENPGGSWPWARLRGTNARGLESGGSSTRQIVDTLRLSCKEEPARPSELAEASICYRLE